MINKRLTNILLAATLLMPCSCTKSNGDLSGASEFSGSPVSFSIYTPAGMVSKGSGAVTKGLSYDLAGIGTKGVGVFAFYQKAKSNGYPVNFSHDVARTEPNFMYNQKLEREETEPGIFSWTYSPKKYWPNNHNDQLSFFAYAPYDVATSWDEDMAITCNAEGTKISRHYYVYPDVADQKDFLWADPVLNVQKQDIGDQINFQFRHICPRISVSTKCNRETSSIYVTVDEVTVSGRFNIEGDIVYTTEDSQTSWTNIKRAVSPINYNILPAEKLPDDSFVEKQIVTTTEELVGGANGYMFPLAGTQNITLHAIVSQRSSTTSFCKSFSIDRTFTAMELQAGKAYNFLLDITLTPVTFSGVVDAEWSSSVTNYTSTDQGDHWTSN